MVLVNFGASNAPGFLHHSDINGPPTYADTIFPAFLFAAGLSSPRKTTVGRSLQRALLLGVYGVFYNLSPLLITNRAKLLDISTWRLPSVIGRIGLSSAVGSLDSFFASGVWPLTLTASYFALQALFSKPSSVGVSGTVDSRLDAAVLGPRHLYQPEKPFDPEGLFGTLFSSPLTFLGGLYFKTLLPSIKEQVAGLTTEPIQQSGIWTALGLGSAVLSRIVGPALSNLLHQPSSKNFWTPVFVVETIFTSISAYFTAEALIALDRARVPYLSNGIAYARATLQQAGAHSLDYFLLHSIIGTALQRIVVHGNASTWTLFTAVFERLGLSNSLAGVATSGLFAWSMAELVYVMTSRDIHFRA